MSVETRIKGLLERYNLPPTDENVSRIKTAGMAALSETICNEIAALQYERASREVSKKNENNPTKND